MKSYSHLAKLYKKVMSHVEYSSWAHFILEQIDPRTNVLELAGGAGLLAQEFQDSFASYHLSDLSFEMLSEASGLPKSQSDMAQLPYQSKSFDVVLCCYDSINYLLEEEQLQSHFREVARVLRSGGVYHFDTTTIFSSYHFFDDYLDYEEFDNNHIIRKAWIDSDEDGVEFQKNQFIFFEEQDNVFIKHEETHTQRLWQHSTILEVLAAEGFVLEKCLSDFTSESIHEETTRCHYFVTKA